MTYRQRYFGIAVVTAAALIPLSANATTVPNLLNGGDPTFDTPANPSSLMDAKFTGVTTETAAIGTGVNGGSCNSGSCAETTWGVGNLTNVLQESTTNQSWQSGDKSGGPTGQAISFVLYDVADKSVTSVNNGTSTTETVKNLGANTSTFGAADGLIHLDLYYMPSTDKPCFTTGCGPNEVAASARTANLGNTAQVTGITNVGQLFASITLQEGTDADGTITLSQSVTFDNITGKTTGSGNQANFYGACQGNSPAGAGCSEFQPVTEASFSAGSFFGSLITQVFGNIGIATAPGAGFETPNSAGWLFATNDPVRFLSPVPEPTSLALLGSALAFFGVAVRRRRKGMSA